MENSLISKNNPSAAMQRYAAEIFRLEQDNDSVSLSLLAQNVDASHQAISRMVHRLTEAGFAKFEAYQGVRLTEKGQQMAMPSLRRHRLGEVFLVNVMGYDWADAHTLADQFEKGINAELEERLSALTDHPTHCPHGEPIPDRKGNIIEPNDRPLFEEEIGRRYRLSRVRTHNIDKLKYLDKLDMRPGLEFFFVSKAPFRGPLRMRMENNESIIGFELASSFWVENI